MKITSEQQEETKIEQERRIYLIGWELHVQNKKKSRGMKYGNKRKRIILMRFRKKRKSFSIWEYFICRRKYREIIKGEETDRAAVFAAGLCVNNWSTQRKSLDINKSSFGKVEMRAG